MDESCDHMQKMMTHIVHRAYMHICEGYVLLIRITYVCLMSEHEGICMCAVARAVERHSGGCGGDYESIGGGPGQEQHSHGGAAIEDVEVLLAHGGGGGGRC